MSQKSILCHKIEFCVIKLIVFVTKFNSVPQKSILCNKIQFCVTKLKSVQQNPILCNTSQCYCTQTGFCRRSILVFNFVSYAHVWPQWPIAIGTLRVFTSRYPSSCEFGTKCYTELTFGATVTVHQFFCILHLWDRIEFCDTKFNFVTKNWHLRDRTEFCDTELNFVTQNWILWHRIEFCDTKFNFFTQNWLLTWFAFLWDTIDFCDTKFNFVSQNWLLWDTIEFSLIFNK